LSPRVQRRATSRHATGLALFDPDLTALIVHLHVTQAIGFEPKSGI
jgi:hypothetical protein